MLLFTYVLATSPSTLFPYTTLFRSATLPDLTPDLEQSSESAMGFPRRATARWLLLACLSAATLCAVSACSGSKPKQARSEEHTSELQSPCNLVCRLLLEKKKKIKKH